MKNFRYILFFVIIFFSYGTFAQTSLLKGFVYDQSNGEPIGYCPIQLKGTAYGTMSLSNGSFIIDKIPKGEYVVEISFFGYDAMRDTVSLKGGNITKRYLLNPTKVSLDEVQVTAESQRKIQETRAAVVSINPKEMSKMPAIGGQPDFAQYLQVLPGIVSSGDQGGQLYVRGGTPIQNMLLLDGMIVCNPFHSIGLFSVFDTEIMSNADIYTGGYNAEFGGRISSVMDIQTRDGNKKRISGKIDLSNIGAQLLLEGPLVKLKEGRKTSLSYLLSAKGSFLEQSSKLFYRYTGEESLPYTFFDFYGKLTLATTGGTKLNFFGFNFDDMVNYSSVANYKWKNWGVGTNFLIVPGGVPTTIEGTISYSNYTSSLDDKAYYPRESSLDGFSVNLTFNYYVGKSTFNIGFDVVGFTTDYNYHSAAGIPYEITDYTTDLGLFIKYKYNFKNKLLIEPGFRLQYYASLGTTSPEPRLALKYNITDKIRLKLAGGLYSQNYVAATSDRDVVNLFYGFLSSLSDLPSTLPNGKKIKDKLQKSQHVVLGLELDVIKHTTINIEGYFKNFSQLLSLNRYKVYENNDTYQSKPEILRSDFIWEKGYACGGDVTIKFDYKGFYIWAVYSLGWVKRNDGVVVYSPHFDRRHNLNLLASYAFGKRRSWQVDARWNFGSGFPFTQTQAYYPEYMPSNIGSDYVSSNESIDFILADLNGGRLPNYHRLDFGLKKKFFIGKTNSIELSASVTNVYNYKNIFYVNRLTNDVIYQLPFLYYFGLNWRF